MRSLAIPAVVSLFAGGCFLAAEDEGTNVSPTLTPCVAGPRPSTGFALQAALGDQAFTNPVAMLPMPTDPSRFYVVEKTGFVRLASTHGTRSLFADVHTLVNAVPNEAGLLGLALHPHFASNGIVFLSYTKPSATSPAHLASVIARGHSADGGLTLDPSTIVELISFDQPYANHNGGNIAFGADGMLYAGYGDGGSGGDPLGNGQNKNVPFGKILRIDVDHGATYAIPADNPFASGGGKPEIYAYGVRNPWRFSFDRSTGDLWIADVGQGEWEEVDVAWADQGGGRGANFGWSAFEGTHRFNDDQSADGVTMPVRR